MSGHIVYWLGTITAMITAFYSFRLISMTFLTTPNAPKVDYEHTHEQPFVIVVPLVVLALMSIFFGYVAKDSFVGMGSDMLATSLFVHPSHITLVEAEFSIPTFYKLLPAVGTVGGAALALLMYHQLANFTVDLALSDLGKRIYTFLNAKWYFDAVFNHYVVGKAFGLGMITSKVLDRGAIELLGPFGLTNSLYGGSRNIALLDTSVVTDYAMYIMIGLLSLVLIIFSNVFSLDFRFVIVIIATLLCTFKSPFYFSC